jgi:hypothetical protein
MIIGPHHQAARTGIELATKKGTHIPNEQRSERARAALLAAAELWARLKPDAVLRSSTNTYNCVAVGSGNSGRWFPEILAGAEDDGSGSWLRSSFVFRVR